MLIDVGATVTRAVNEGSFPRKLFKYRCIAAYTESIFRDHQLWFAQMDSFNDPFDCQVCDPGNYSSSELMQYLTSQGMTPVEASNFVLHEAKKPGFIDTLINESRRKVLANWGVLALSKRRDQLLMWAHYCSKHTGFVLGFDVLECPEFFAIPVNVRYQYAYPGFRFLTESEKVVTHGIATKSSHWAYEEEVRVLKSPAGAHTFSKSALKELILGCRVSDADRDLLLGHLKKYGYNHVEVFQAKCSANSYQLDIKKVSVGN